MTIKEINRRIAKISLAISLACLTSFIAFTVHGHSLCSSIFTKQTRPLVGNNKVDQVMDLLFYSEKRKFDKDNPDATNDYFQMVWESKAFADYLKLKKMHLPVNASYELKYKMLAEYVLNFMTPYQQPALLYQQQKHALREALELRGITVGNVDPYIKLAEVSRENLLRILNKHQINVETQMSKIGKVVENLELFFSHNSHIMRKAPGLPVLAPLEIEKIGLSDFGRSSNIFNRFIKSDKQVYFWALFKKKHSELQTTSSEYGEWGVVINREYARNHLWVSPFVMYEWQLVDSLRNYAPSVANALDQALIARRESPTQYSNYNSVVNSQAEIRAAQNELGQLDFTPHDYEVLIKVTLIKALQNLQAQNEEKYNEAINMLTSNKIEDINSTIRKLAFPIFEYKNKNGFEGKVPIAVPATELSHFGPE